MPSVIVVAIDTIYLVGNFIFRLGVAESQSHSDDRQGDQCADGEHGEYPRVGFAVPSASGAPVVPRMAVVVMMTHRRDDDDVH